MRDTDDDLLLDPEDCLHPGRPSEPRLVDDGKSWHCESCDTSFVATLVPVWREL